MQGRWLSPGFGALTALTLVASVLLGADDGALAVEDEQGAPVSLAPSPGESALVAHFWATWCRSCLEELPALARSARGCADGTVRVVTVNVGEDPATVARYLEAHPFDLPVLRDPKGHAWRRVGRGLPANLVWTRDGRRTEVGPRDEASWRRELAALGCVSP